MAAEDYMINGVNISRIVKDAKIKYGWCAFYRIKNKYNPTNIENRNNIIYFEIGEYKYKFGLSSQKITKVGSSEWFSKPITYIKIDVGY